MLNRIFLSLASIGVSLVLAYAHLSQWWLSREETVKAKPIKIDNIHFHAGEMVLSSDSLLVFGVLFLLVGICSVVVTLLRKWNIVFFCFVAAMVLIWIRITAGIQ